MVDSTAIEGQFLIAGAGNKEACEAKGKRWKARFGSAMTTADCNKVGHYDKTEYCSCHK